MTLPVTVPRPVRAGAAVLALALSIGLGACGAGAASDGVVSLHDPSATAGASAVPTASIDPQDAMVAFQQCMKEHGVDVQVATAGQGTVTQGAAGPVTAIGSGAPNAGAPQVNTNGPDPSAMAAADTACHHLLPQGGMDAPGATMDPAIADAMVKFSQCMRDHGVNMPDPQFSGNGVTVQVGSGGDGGIDPSSTAYQAAQTACAAVMPSGAPFVVGGSGTSIGVKP